MYISRLGSMLEGHRETTFSKVRQTSFVGGRVAI
jgi:hypothetical protein